MQQRRTSVFDRCPFAIHNGTFTVPKCKTMNDLLEEYISLYGKATWSMSTYTANTGLVEHYVTPVLGDMKLKDITTRVIEKYYQQLLKMKPVTPVIGKRKNEFLTPHTVRSIHKLLHSCFEQAVKWELMEKIESQAPDAGRSDTDQESDCRDAQMKYVSKADSHPATSTPMAYLNSRNIEMYTERQML